MNATTASTPRRSIWAVVLPAVAVAALAMVDRAISGPPARTTLTVSAQQAEGRVRVVTVGDAMPGLRVLAEGKTDAAGLASLSVPTGTSGWVEFTDASGRVVSEPVRTGSEPMLVRVPADQHYPIALSGR